MAASVASPTISGETSSPSTLYVYTECIASCLQQATLTAECTTADCVCEAAFVTAALPCLHANCTAEDVESAFSLWASECGTGSAIITEDAWTITDTPMSSSATSSVTASLTIQSSTPVFHSSLPAPSSPTSGVSPGPSNAPVRGSSPGPSLALTVALPIVLGASVLASLIFVIFRRRRRSRDRVTSSNLVSPLDVPSREDGKDESCEVTWGEDAPAFYGAALYTRTELGPGSTDAQAGSTFPQDAPEPEPSLPAAEPGPRAARSRPRARRRRKEPTPPDAANPHITPRAINLPSHFSPPATIAREAGTTSQRTRSLDDCDPFADPRTDAEPPTRERVLVLPWALGQRLLALAGGALSRDTHEGSVDLEPPPAYGV